MSLRQWVWSGARTGRTFAGLRLQETGPYVKLSDIPQGEHVVLAEFGSSALHLQLLAMGFNPGASVKLVRRMPLRGNLYLQIGTRRLVLRHAEAEQLLVAKSV